MWMRPPRCWPWSMARRSSVKHFSLGECCGLSQHRQWKTQDDSLLIWFIFCIDSTPIITSVPSEDHTYSAGGGGNNNRTNGNVIGMSPINNIASVEIVNTSVNNTSDNASNGTSSDAAYESSEERWVAPCLSTIVFSESNLISNIPQFFFVNIQPAACDRNGSGGATPPRRCRCISQFRNRSIVDVVTHQASVIGRSHRWHNGQLCQWLPAILLLLRWFIAIVDNIVGQFGAAILGCRCPANISVLTVAAKEITITHFAYQIEEESMVSLNKQNSDDPLLRINT